MYGLLELTLSFFYLQLNCQFISCTIDINLSELEYLAGHLNTYECIRLIAALHYTAYDLPKSIAATERKVAEDIPCLHQLIHWNSLPNEGKGKTHEHLERRLRQLNRHDLADWLGKTVFKQLGNDLEKSLKNPFGELGEKETETQYPVTLDPVEKPEEENPWLPLDTLLMTLLAGLLATFVTLTVAFAVYNIKLKLQQRALEKDEARKHCKKCSSRKFRKDDECG